MAIDTLGTFNLIILIPGTFFIMIFSVCILLTRHAWGGADIGIEGNFVACHMKTMVHSPTIRMVTNHPCGWLWLDDGLNT